LAAPEKTVAGARAETGPGARRRRGLLYRLRRSFDKYWAAYVMLAPTMIVMSILVFYPLVKGIGFSSTNADRYNFGSVDFPSSYERSWANTKANYEIVFNDKESRSVLGFTAVWTFVNVFFHFVIGLGLAVLMNRTLRFRGFYRLLLLVPWALPTFIAAFSWRYLYNDPYGFFVQALKAIGVADPPAFLGDPTWAKVAVISANVWAGVPFMMVALLGGLQAIDSDLLEAAEVDGASAWQRFWGVTMPGLRPVASTVILLGIIWTFNSFVMIFLMTGGGPGTDTQILTTYAYRYFADYQLYGIAAAYGVVTLSLLLVFSTFYRLVVRRLGEESWA
jgi:arabinogalactan oligomer/maltooligosaccharide transport system permease protein